MLDGCSHMLCAPGVISFPLWRPHHGALEIALAQWIGRLKDFVTFAPP
jgi:hypothetical protein